MISNHELKSAGEIQVKKSYLITKDNDFVDIQNQVISYNIYEDLFSPFITGNIVIQDPLSMIANLPIIGEEFLELLFVTPELDQKKDSISGKFAIYKITDYEYLQNRLVGYVIHFVSKEAIIDLNVKISKKFDDKSISHIASDILKMYSTFQGKPDEVTEEQLSRFNIEETQNGHTYISNYWSPVKNLNYLAEHAITKNRTLPDGTVVPGTPSYLFFENKNGLNFISLESLYMGDSTRTFTYNDFNRNFSSDGSSTRDIERNYSNVIELKIIEAFNYMDRIRGGAFTSNLNVYNLTTKTYKSFNYDYKDHYDESIRLNPFSSVSKKVISTNQSCMINVPKMNGIYSGSLHNISNSNVIQKRMSIMSLAHSMRVQITVYGRTDYTVGQKVTLDLYREEPTYQDDMDLKDNTLSGNYIIGSLRHFIDRTYHECVMELIKDSSIVNLNRG
jgi:hypothetical protein